MFSKTLKISMLSAAITTLAACGGGGGGSDSAAPAYKGNTVNGVAVDFYLKDALIRFSNPNCAPIRTNAQGQFSFTTTATCQSSEMLISGGIDLGTGLPFTGRLQLKNTNFNQATQLAVTPLTTLEKHLVDAGQQALLPTILQNLGINDVDQDLSTFNPVTDANAQTAAAVFALQQLVNKIEDNLESLQINGTSAFSADQAAQIAENQLQAQDPDATIPASLISDIAADSVKLSTLLDTLVQQGGDGQQLLLELQKPENQAVLEETLQPPPAEIITQPIYGDFSVADYSVMDLKNSSQVQPIELDLKDIDTVVEFNFGIQNTQKALQDNFKLGFSIQAQTNNRTETLDVILDEVQVTFDKTGRIATASINKDTLLTVASSLNFPIPGTSASTSYASFELPRAFSVSNNRTISLSQLLNSDQRLKSAYDTYKASLVSGNSLRAKIFVAPTNYQIDGNLGLDVSSMSIRNINFSAPSVAAYFKLK